LRASTQALADAVIAEGGRDDAAADDFADGVDGVARSRRHFAQPESACTAR